MSDMRDEIEKRLDAARIRRDGLAAEIQQYNGLLARTLVEIQTYEELLRIPADSPPADAGSNPTGDSPAEGHDRDQPD